MKIEGKVALVTGGGTGVGRATALALARGGCSVAINYSKSKEEAEATAHAVEASGARAGCTSKFRRRLGLPRLGRSGGGRVRAAGRPSQ